MTEQEYARFKNVPLREIQDRFAATGMLRCENHAGSAQLTDDARTLTTSGHIFLDPDSCRIKNRPESCKFIYKVRGVSRSVATTDAMDIGFRCPGEQLGFRDWAIVKLAEPITDVQPYDLPGEFDDPVPGTKLISVAVGAKDFLRVDKSTGKTVRPKSIEECSAKFLYPGQGGFNSVQFESDCDSGPGASGGSILKMVGERLILVGINVGQVVRDANPNANNRYLQGLWANLDTTLYGEFLERLKRSVSQ